MLFVGNDELVRGPGEAANGQVSSELNYGYNTRT